MTGRGTVELGGKHKVVNALQVEFAAVGVDADSVRSARKLFLQVHSDLLGDLAFVTLLEKDLLVRRFRHGACLVVVCFACSALVGCVLRSKKVRPEFCVPK